MPGPVSGTREQWSPYRKGGAGMARSPADQGKTLLETIENARAESRSRNENFTGITKDDIGKKTKAKDPFLSGFGWTKETPPGGRIDLRLFIANAEVANIYVHVWVGSGNIDPVVGTFLTNVDPRFPRLTEPSFPGLAEFPGSRIPSRFRPGQRGWTSAWPFQPLSRNRSIWAISASCSWKDSRSAGMWLAPCSRSRYGAVLPLPPPPRAEQRAQEPRTPPPRAAGQVRSLPESCP